MHLGLDDVVARCTAPLLGTPAPDGARVALDAGHEEEGQEQAGWQDLLPGQKPDGGRGGGSE